MTRTTLLLSFLFACPFVIFAQLPSGAVALYPLNNTINDVSGNGYDGTLSSTSAGVNRFGTSGSSTSFTSGSSTGTLPVGLVTAMKDDFTIAYWFNTTMNAPGSSQWYGGSALVDAEVCGGTTDWGTALIDGGAVCMGIGNPDITIKSSSTAYNDGAWHFVTGTRNEAAGVITLYVDGVQVATTSGTATSARTAPTLIGLGRNPCVVGGVYTGALDDVIAYGRELSSTEVSNLYTYYSATVLPLKWVSVTAQVDGGFVDLSWRTASVTNNDHFEIERSTGGSDFEVIGSLAGKNISVAGAFSFTDSFPGSGDNLYRIKQIDIDGRYSWSPVVEAKIVAGSGIYLQGNPVKDVVTIVNPGQQMVRRLQVVDLSGRVLQDRGVNSANGVFSENVSGLRAGYYFLRVYVGGKGVVMRFVKL